MRIAALMIAATAKNGAGKSTLMHILEGDRQSNEGEILIDGLNWTPFVGPRDVGFKV